ncbi:hypothetical protein [Rhizobium sp. Root483D2]|uniref:hypothetical protein n=1 Tax=Rhizobium sp. Root483D2 TaxID=1736545 RepID=UPI0007141D60|nr:hypothetical protein [Rhizobium sp. Root483D2]KQY42574.1 hypothetical protein ASD32_14560 [Rhizobium sp. Root483D2]
MAFGRERAKGLPRIVFRALVVAGDHHIAIADPAVRTIDESRDEAIEGCVNFLGTMRNLPWLPLGDGEPGDAAIVDGIENFAVIVGENDFAPRRPEIIGRMGSMALADMKCIDFRIDRKRGAAAGLDIVEQVIASCKRCVAPMPPKGSSITRPNRSWACQSGKMSEVAAVFPSTRTSNIWLFSRLTTCMRNPFSHRNGIGSA